MQASGDRAAEAGKLISLAEAAAARDQWLETLDFASQALSADPGQSAAAVLVGTARERLGSVSATSAELRQITVVAVDMYRSTGIAASIGPERMRELMLELYEACIDAVTRFDGRVTKYLGDGVLAQFGHPIAHEDDARRAVLASLAVLEQVEAKGPEWEAWCGEPVMVRIGVDSGLAAVGPVDASPWSAEEIAGDPPNIASRVQATAERMTVRITDATEALIKGWFETLPAGPVVLRNYPDPVVLYRVLAPSEAETRLEARGDVRPPLLGRDAEVAALRAAWKRVAAEGERQIVSLTGEAGIGKSRLVEHLVATGVASGASHVTLACSRLHGESALRPVARALARFFRLSPRERGNDALSLDAIRRQLEQLPNRRVATEAAVPIYGWLLGIHSAVDLEPEELRRRAFEAVIDLFEAIALSSNLVVCIDDVDTADPSTIELMRALLARPPTPMLIVPTGRGPLPELNGADATLEVRGLSADDSAAVVRAVAPSLEGEVVARIVACSDGVPYYLEEQARAALEADGPARRAPLALSVFLGARLDELGAERKQLLGEIAVAGEGIWVDVLRSFTEVPAERLDRLLDELSARRVLLRVEGPGGELVRFRHSLMREAAYDGILEARRIERHRRLAALLAERRPRLTRPEDLARHYELAGAGAEAARSWLEAGRRAAASGANTEAIDLFRSCLAALAAQSEDASRAELELEAQLGLGTTLSTVEGYTSQGARTSFERAVALGESLGDSRTIFPAVWGTSSYWFVLGEHRVVGGLVDRLLRIASEESDPRFRYEAGFVAGYQRFHLGDFESARTELEQASHHIGLEPVADFAQDPGIVSRSMLAVVLWFLGDRERSEALAEEALALAEALDPDGRRTALTECWVNANLAWRAELGGDSERAIEFANRTETIASERGYVTWLAAAVLHRSIAQCRLGRLDEALPTLTAMVEAWQSVGRDPSGRQLHPVLMTPYFAGRLAEALLARGESEEAAARLDQLLAETAASGERFWDTELERLRASAAGERVGS